MRALIVRHYKTRFNETGRIMGWEDSPRGREWRADVDFVDTRLRELDIVFDRGYSSDLERSRETATIYARNLDIPRLYATPQLNEINYGKLQKTKKRCVRRFFPQHKQNPDLVYPGGESFRQMQQRSVAFLASLASEQSGQTILVVTHAGVIRGIVCHFLGLELGSHLEQKIPFRYIGDFGFDDDRCAHYEELGQPSGFVASGVIESHWDSRTTRCNGPESG